MSQLATPATEETVDLVGRPMRWQRKHVQQG
jgi:hypothetical protein